MMYEKGAQARETPGLEDYLAAIRQRKWLILLCVILGLALASFVVTSRTDTYTAAARVLVNPTPVGSTNNNQARPVLEREREVLKGNTVAELVADDLSLNETPESLLRNLTVLFIDDSDSLELIYEDTDPIRAQQLVNSFAQQYVDHRVGQAVDFHDTIIAQLVVVVDEIDVEIAELESTIADLSQERSRIIALEGDPSAVDDQINNSRTAISTLLTDRRNPSNQLSQARLDKGIQIAPAEVLQFASVPEVPDGLSDNLIRTVGLIFGAGAGVSLAFVLQRLDRTARESGDVELALGANVLASIPAFGLGNASGSSSVVMLAGGKSARIQRAREAFRRLRSSIQFLGSSQDSKSYLVTSARPSEGKSTTSINLAVAMAQGGASVCLVNADLRRPTLERLLGLPNQRGLATWLEDNSVTDIMVPVANTPGLVLVPSGPPPGNPGELLATGGLNGLLKELAEKFDVVIIDAPPVLSAADASAIAPAVDGVIVVVDAKRTDTDALLRVRSEMDRSGGLLLGAVLNRDSSEGGSRVGRNRYSYERVSAGRATQ